MAYRKWTIGGLTPSWVEPDFIDDRENNTLTLKCMAGYDETGADPMVEVEAFDALTSEKINNDSLLNGGTKLQVRGQIVTVTATNEEGTETKTWERCAIRKVKVNLDSYYNEDNVGSIIEYELVITYQTQGGPGGTVYYPNYDEHDNFEYYMWTDKTNPVGQHDAYGNEFGYIKIVEPQNVARVEIRGSGDCGETGTDCWVEVNGVRKFWHYTDIGDKKLFEGNNLAVGEETLSWDLDTPTTEIIIETSIHTEDAVAHPCDVNKGCWARWIRVFYASE
jgi:hypothetical protein